MKVKDFLEKLEEVQFTEHPLQYDVVMLSQTREHTLKGVTLDEEHKKLILWVD